MDYELRACTINDLDFVFELKKIGMKWYIEKLHGWDDEIQKNITAHELEKYLKFMQIIMIDGKDVGVTSLWQYDDYYEVGLIAVHPNYQGKGIASSILRKHIQKARADKKRLLIKAYKENPALRVYVKVGFRQYKTDDTHVYLDIDFSKPGFDRLHYALQDCKLDEFNNLLGESLYYYCAGKDITPIINLSDKVRLFIYADLMRGRSEEFANELQVLYDRIKTANFNMKRVEEFSLGGKFKAQLSMWESENNTFYLLYVLGDATKIYKQIYHSKNVLVPKFMCNIKYEMDTSFFLKIEKEVEYILGHLYSGNYACVDVFEYKGDYSLKGNKVYLYKKKD